jgi:hypothetical protein
MFSNILTCTFPISLEKLRQMKTEAQTSTKVIVRDQKDLNECKLEGVKLLFTCLRVAELMDTRREGFNPFRAVEEAKHIIAEAIGAKECSCQMCICDVLQENSLLGKGVL